MTKHTHPVGVRGASLPQLLARTGKSTKQQQAIAKRVRALQKRAVPGRQT